MYLTHKLCASAQHYWHYLTLSLVFIILLQIVIKVQPFYSFVELV